MKISNFRILTEAVLLKQTSFNGVEVFLRKDKDTKEYYLPSQFVLDGKDIMTTYMDLISATIYPNYLISNMNFSAPTEILKGRSDVRIISFGFYVFLDSSAKMTIDGEWFDFDNLPANISEDTVSMLENVLHMKKKSAYT